MNKNERIFKIIGDIDDDLIENSVKKKVSYKWMGIAAAFVAVAVTGIFALTGILPSEHYDYAEPEESFAGGIQQESRSVPEEGMQDGDSVVESPEAQEESTAAPEAGMPGGDSVPESEEAPTAGEEASGYMSYAGAILPITFETEQDITATRNIDFDFAPLSHGENYIHVTDEYTLTNDTDADVTVQLLYPFMSSLTTMEEIPPPTLIVDGGSAQSEIFVGDAFAGFNEIEGGNGEMLEANLGGVNSYEDMLEVLQNPNYITDATDGQRADIDERATVYEVSFPQNVPEDSDVIVFTEFDTGNTRMYTQGFTMGDGEEGANIVGFDVTERESVGSHYVVAVGEDFTNFEAYVYTGEWLENRIEAVEFTRTEMTLTEALSRVAQDYYEQNKPNAMDVEMYAELFAEYYAQYSQVDRYTMFVHDLFTMLTDVTAVNRICYVGAEVTIPAGQSVKVVAEFDKVGSFDFIAQSEDEEGLFGFEILPTSGSNVDFTQVTASTQNTDNIEIVDENFGFEDGRATIDTQNDRYYIEVKGY